MLNSIKNDIRISKIECTNLCVEDIKKLFELVKTHNVDAERYHLQYTDEFNLRSEINYPQEEVNKFKTIVKSKYITGIAISTRKGQFIQTYDPGEILSESKFPDDILKIVISNKFLFQNQSDIYQLNQISVELDFSKPTLIELSSNPSNATVNYSKIEVVGSSESWVDGVNKIISDFFNERQNKRKWLHKKGMYDLILWTVILPIVFWNIYKFDIWITNLVTNLSSVILVFLYIYLSVVMLIIFALLFKYLRYVYPPIELKENVFAKKKLVPTFFSFGISVFYGYLLLKAISFLIDFLF